MLDVNTERKKIIWGINIVAYVLAGYSLYRFWNAPKVSESFPFISGSEVSLLVTMTLVVNGLLGIKYLIRRKGDAPNG
jgi:hypothetical protein